MAAKRQDARCHYRSNRTRPMLITDDLPAFTLLAGLLGLCIGSFLNVVIYRLPQIMEQEWASHCAALRGEEETSAHPALSLSHPRSHCPHCGRAIKPWELIPVVSYFLILRGKCAGCSQTISLRYPMVELLTGALSAWTVWSFGPTPQGIGALLLLWSLIALTFIDFDTQLLPDSITMPLIWLGIAFNLFHTYTDLQASVIGAMAGYLTLWSIYWLFRLVTGKEGMGYGDFKLLAAIGAWLGWQTLPAVVLVSSLLGSVVGISMILFGGHSRQVPIPFGPYLAAAGAIALFWGKYLTSLYLYLPG